MKKLNPKGFAHAGLILFVLVVIAAVGGVGYYVWSQNKGKNTQNSKQADSQANPQTDKLTKKYVDSVGRFSIEYPESAKLEHDTGVSAGGSEHSSAMLELAKGAQVMLTSNSGGKGIPYNCTYDEVTKKTTWDDPTAKGECPHTTYSKIQELNSTAYDEDGQLQHLYLVEKSYTDPDENETIRIVTIAFGKPGVGIGQKEYGLNFTEESITTFTKEGTIDRFIHAYTNISTESDFFDRPATKEAEAVLATFKFTD